MTRYEEKKKRAVGERHGKKSARETVEWNESPGRTDNVRNGDVVGLHVNEGEDKSSQSESRQSYYYLTQGMTLLVAASP